MAVLGDITKININGNELTIKDGALTDAVEQIVDAITDNNQVISERINNLNSRLETIEGSNFCTKDELIDDEEVIAETFNDINTRLEYAENNLGETNVIEVISFNGQTAVISGKTAVILTDIEKTPLVTGIAASSVTIEPYKMYSFGTVSTSMNIVYDTSKEVSGYCAQYMFRFVAGANCEITLPNGTKFEENGSNITFVTGRTYEYNITDGLCVIVEFL